MYDRADAHIHLFRGGYRRAFVGRPGVRLDEAACYDSLAREQGVRCALVVGYAAEAWCADNNAWIAEQGRRYPWVRPLAYVDPIQPLGVTQMERLADSGYVGLSMYILGSARARALRGLSAEVWSWLVERQWLVSVNSRGTLWLAWRDILEQHGELRLLISHQGLPPAVSQPPTNSEVGEALAPVLALADFAGPRAKLSGFYALTDPAYDYPHRAVWPYVQALLAGYGFSRLLWGSDYTPCLDDVTFPQTYALFAQMPFLSETQRRAIEGDNLLALLGEV